MSKKQEQAFSTKFRLWAKNNLPTCVIELKHTRGESRFLCKELKEHQYWSLMAAASKTGFAYKIPDDGMGSKPFDMFVMQKVKAFIVIRFPSDVAIIPVAKWDLTLKSITIHDAKKMALPIICEY